MEVLEPYRAIGREQHLRAVHRSMAGMHSISAARMAIALIASLGIPPYPKDLISITKR